MTGYVELGIEIMHHKKYIDSGIQNIKRSRKLVSKKSTHTGDESFFNY